MLVDLFAVLFALPAFSGKVISRPGNDTPEMPNSKGDPRVLFVMNLVLSAAFATLVIWGLSFLDLLSFGWRNVAVLAGLLMVVTHVVTR